MISLIKFAAKKLLDSNEDGEDKKQPQNTNLDEIEQNDTKINSKFTSNQVEEDEKGCIYAYGLVSLVHNSYVLIENRYMCEMKDVIPADLKKGDKVYYVAYKASNGEDLKVRKIICKVGLDWEEQLGIHEGETEPDFFEDDHYDEMTPAQLAELQRTFDNKKKQIDAPAPKPQVTRKTPKSKKKQLCKRVHVGKVDKKNGRLIYLEDKVCIDLDIVNSDFIPVIGDWVQLDCLAEITEDMINFKGAIRQIESIKPHRAYNKIGIITEYNEIDRYGMINNTIIFNKFVCLDGFLPNVGDKVIVQSIESDQGPQIHWRALVVVPFKNVTNNYEISAIKFEPQLPYDKMKELLEDKRDIDITNNICLHLNVKENTLIEVIIKNNGYSNQIIKRCAFLSRRSESQLTLLSPSTNDPVTLKPNGKIIFIFKCNARIVGICKELIIFKFHQFSIGRIIEIIVKSQNSYDILRRETYLNNNSRDKNLSSIIPVVPEDGMYIRGVKPYRPAKFIPVRPVTWKIPPILWSTIDEIVQQKKSRTELLLALQEKIPCLSRPLSFDNYKQRFNYLLYLEEIEIILNMKSFGINKAVLHKSGEYLTLNVPGLAEKRPSLIIGDRVIIYFDWKKESKHYEGYIHKIKSTDVFLKFNAAFHDIYNKEVCTVNFKSSTTVIQRCHAAIGVVVQTLGSEFLFPKKVEQKEPQYNFIEDHEEMLKTEQEKLLNVNSEEDQIKLAESILNQRKIKWFNKNLNFYQKEAIKNILKGLARPMPYIIFGPPGTGKSITVVESILQIYFTVSESRILVATPSNSSANLITERLLNSRVFQPGNLVRLVAYHYLNSNMIPKHLLPFCVTADVSEEDSRVEINQQKVGSYQTQVTLNSLIRHRILIGTCSTLGILYNMGCKPGHFTHMFVDEAGQCSEPEIMIPLSLAHKNLTQVVLAGDPKQLGPIIQSQLAGYFGYNVSFLARLLQQFPYQKDPDSFKTGYDPRLVTKLLINYRSLPDLLALPNKLFYDSELIPQIDPVNSEEATLVKLLTDLLPKRCGDPAPIVFHCVYGENFQDLDSPSWYNPEEAKMVISYFGKLLNYGLTPDDIGIITPYSKQIYHLKNILTKMEIDPPKVGSVEEFQGQERKIIILSTVRTSESIVQIDIRHSLGFVAARERLNVAITRAKAILIIIGHPDLLTQDVYWRNVIEHCRSRSCIIGLIEEEED